MPMPEELHSGVSYDENNVEIEEDDEHDKNYDFFIQFANFIDRQLSRSNMIPTNRHN
jgi:hypothetical protein